MEYSEGPTEAKRQKTVDECPVDEGFLEDNHTHCNGKEDAQFSFESEGTEVYSLNHDDLAQEEDDIDDYLANTLQHQDTIPCIYDNDDLNNEGNSGTTRTVTIGTDHDICVTLNDTYRCKEHNHDIVNSNCNNEERPSPPPELNKIKSVMRDAQFIVDTGITETIDVDLIYDKLKEIRKNPNRVDMITNLILENTDKWKRQVHVVDSSNGVHSASLVEDFVKVIDMAITNMTSLPISADDIHQLLRNEGNRRDRVDRVFTKILQNQYRKNWSKESATGEMVGGKTSLKHDDSMPEDPFLCKDPLFRDMRIIRKVLTEKDPNEIYAYLEAHHDKKNRIQLVIEEFLRHGSDSQNSETAIDGSVASTNTNNGSSSKGKQTKKNTCNLEDEIDELREIFPDCDPNYLYEELERRKDDKDRVKDVALIMLENKNYPKLKETESNSKKQKPLNVNLINIDSFLNKFPEPLETFFDKDRATSETYKQHVKIQLLNDFPLLSEDYLKDLMQTNKHSYTCCRKMIENQMIGLGDFVAELYIEKPRVEKALPEEPDEFFFYEKYFLEQETEVIERLEDLKRIKQFKLEEARSNGELMECNCCFDDECLFEDMGSCADGHIFCKDCIRRSTEVIIGQAKCDFPCLQEDCEYKFQMSVLQDVLSPNMFSILLRRMQEEEIKMADIPDLVSCPFCSFATIMSNPDDKVFRCLNPDCLKDSCRLCREPNHIPLRCEEVEKESETSMRAYIENKVSEAMLRTCHKCKKHFLKDSGCNKMTCTCGATQCYVCRAVDICYDHFTSSPSCSVTDDANTIHIKDMEAAFKEAKDKYIEEHPEYKDVVLKYDPEKHIQDMKQNGGQVFGRDDGEDYDDGSEHEGSSDDDDYY